MKTSVAVRSLHPRLRFDRRSVIKAIAVLDAHLDQLSVPAPRDAAANDSVRELSVVFLTDAALARLHGDFLADPSETDVITFPGQVALGTAGEICISVDAACQAAADRGQPPASELTLYLVHGWLHLAGHRDAQPAERRAMRRAEAKALRLLRAARSLPSFTL